MDLRAARISAGLSQREAADKLGVTFQAWSAWERGLARVPRRAWLLLGAAPDGVGPTPSSDTILTAARTRRGLSIAEAAERLDVHPNTWSAWERGLARAPREAYALVGVSAPDGARALGERTKRVDGPRRRSSYYDRTTAGYHSRVEQALKLHYYGMSPEDIADRIGVCLETVRRYLKCGPWHPQAETSAPPASSAE